MENLENCYYREDPEAREAEEAGWRGCELAVDVDKELRQELVSTAQDYIGTDEFRLPITDNGDVACAAFVSRVLEDCRWIDHAENHSYESRKDEGREYQVREDSYIEDIGFVSVTKLHDYLLTRGWTAHQGPGQPGDVIFWDRVVDNPNMVVGTKHVGVMVGPNQVVSNLTLNVNSQPFQHAAG